MSNAEMPPLACGQVWVVHGDAVVLIGDKSNGGWRYAMAWSDSICRDLHESTEEITGMLVGDGFRLIHGPGAPWSPAEDVPHA